MLVGQPPRRDGAAQALAPGKPARAALPKEGASARLPRQHAGGGSPPPPLPAGVGPASPLPEPRCRISGFPPAANSPCQQRGAVGGGKSRLHVPGGAAAQPGQRLPAPGGERRAGRGDLQVLPAEATAGLPVTALSPLQKATPRSFLVSFSSSAAARLSLSQHLREERRRRRVMRPADVA